MAGDWVTATIRTAVPAGVAVLVAWVVRTLAGIDVTINPADLDALQAALSAVLVGVAIGLWYWVSRLIVRYAPQRIRPILELLLFGSRRQPTYQ